MNPISRSLISRNKAISSALLIMYSLIIALLVMVCSVADSFDMTFDTYFNDYKAFDLLVSTVGTSSSLNSELENIEGVEAVSARIVADKCVQFLNGRTLLTRIMSIDSNPAWKIYDVDRLEIASDREDCVMVSAYFARCNDVSVGSIISIIDGEETIGLKVTNIVSSPETIGVGSYVDSWYDMRDFGFIYVSGNHSEEIFKTRDLANTYKILVDEGSDIGRIQDTVKETIGENYVLDMTAYEDSAIKTQIDSSIDTVRSITLYLPAMIIIIGVLFSLLFIYQVTRKSRKEIALLRAIGYSKRRVQKIFNIYILSLSLTASLIGIGIGIFLLRFVINIYRDFYYLPYVCYSGNIAKTALIIVMINVMAVLSCILACRDISRIEPALAFGEDDTEESADLPKSLSDMRCNPFTKLSLTLIYRNRRRVVVVFLCMLACMFLSMISLSVLINKNYALKKIFSERYDFELAVLAGNPDELAELCKQEFVKEYRLTFQNDFIYEDEAMRVEEKSMLVEDDCIVLEKGFARRHNLSTGDTLTIKGTDLMVSAIQDQYLCSTQYVNFATLEKMGYKNPNVAILYLKDKADKNEAMAYVSKMDKFYLTLDIESIKTCAEDTMANIDMPCYIITAFSGLIGFIIMYNMALISFDKRRKEFTVLRAIGTENYRIVRLLFGESLCELAAAAIVAPALMPLISLLLTLISSPSEEYALMNPAGILLLGFGFTAIYTIAGVLITCHSIREIDIATELNG